MRAILAGARQSTAVDANRLNALPSTQSPRRQLYINDPGVVSSSPVSSQVLSPERIIGQPP